MNAKRKLHIVITAFLLTMLIIVLPHKAYAEEQVININNNDKLSIMLTEGDEIKLNPVVEGSASDYIFDYYCIYADSIYIEDDGLLKAYDAGKYEVEITAWLASDISKNTVFSATLKITVYPDMTDVTLKTDSVEVYLKPFYNYMNHPGYGDVLTKIPIVYPKSQTGDTDDGDVESKEYYYDDDDDYYTDDYDDEYDLSYSCTNKKLKLKVSVYSDKLYIEQKYKSRR